MVSRTALLVPGLAFALASSLLLPRAAHADIVALPDPEGCSVKAKGDACKDHGQAGTCQPDQCSQLDYSKGTPPSSVEYDCLTCKVGAAPATPTPAVTTPATTPVTVVSPTVAPTVAPTVLPTTPVPAVDAAAYVVYDPATGESLAELGADDRRAVGSTMKLLGVYVGMQAGDPDRLATVPALDLDAAESSIGLREGEQYSRALLMRAMLIVSANDAARTLAVDVAGSEAAFVEQMNAAAASLGLTNTAAANPVGLDDPAAYSSARDLAALAAVLMNDATFQETVARRSAKLHGTTFAATNKLLGTYDGADGVKTGRTTQAGWCVVASATRDGRRFIVVVLGASSDEARFASASALLDWAFAQ